MVAAWNEMRVVTGCKWGGTMGTNGSQAAARGAAFNLIVLGSRRDLQQWLATCKVPHNFSYL